MPRSAYRTYTVQLTNPSIEMIVWSVMSTIQKDALYLKWQTNSSSQPLKSWLDRLIELKHQRRSLRALRPSLFCNLGIHSRKCYSLKDSLQETNWEITKFSLENRPKGHVPTWQTISGQLVEKTHHRRSIDKWLSILLERRQSNANRMFQLEK